MLKVFHFIDWSWWWVFSPMIAVGIIGVNLFILGKLGLVSEERAWMAS